MLTFLLNLSLISSFFFLFPFRCGDVKKAEVMNMGLKERQIEIHDAIEKKKEVFFFFFSFFFLFLFFFFSFLFFFLFFSFLFFSFLFF